MIRVRFGSRKNINAAEIPVSGIGARRRFPRDRKKKDGKKEFMGRKTDKKRGPLSSFPWKGKFKTNAEIKAYFSGDKIECFLCGKRFHALSGTHLRVIHGVSPDDYREMYGIPWGNGLIGMLSHEKRSISAKRLIAEGKIKPLAKGEPRLSSKSPDRRPHPECILTGLKKWHQADYEAAFDKMRTLKRPLRELCKNDPDLPSLTSFMQYMDANPEFAAKLQKFYDSQPYSFQSRIYHNSPRFRIDCERLRTEGMTQKEIAIKLAVSPSTVSRMLKDFDVKMGILRISYRKWRRRDFEAILERMRDQRRVFSDVCEDPDLPCLGTWLEYVKKHPEFKKKLQDVYHGMPYSIQSRVGNLSPRFYKDCERLRSEGMENREIADKLMVPIYHVRKALRGFDKKRGIVRPKPADHIRKDFEGILNRMRVQQRTLFDVCGDPDLPSDTSCRYHEKKHPEFAEKLREITLGLPYHLQVMTRDPSPRFSVDCHRLRAAGMSLKNIAKSLGAPLVAVKREFGSLGGKLTRPLQGGWSREAFETILVRIRERRLPLQEVCEDSDLPNITTWGRFVKTHPEFKEKLREVYHSLPYSFQARVYNYSPRFHVDCERLRADGMSIGKIAKTFKVSNKSVSRVLRDFDEKMGIVRPKRADLGRKDFEAILNRMRVQQRLLGDVCGDPDLPSHVTFGKYIKKHPELAEKLRETILGLPYPIQGKSRKFPPRIRIDCERLRAAGMSIANIQKALGVSQSTVTINLRDYNKRRARIKSGSPEN